MRDRPPTHHHQEERTMSTKTATRHGTTPTGLGTVNARIGGPSGTVHLVTEFTYADGTRRLGWAHCGADSNLGSHLVPTTDAATCPRCH